jgi:hypothetical protein
VVPDLAHPQSKAEIQKYIIALNPNKDKKKKIIKKKKK